MSENTIDVTDSDFEEKVVAQSKELPVVVDFWADWCMPCKMLSPAMDTIAKKHKDKIMVAKLNVDDNPVISNQFGIMSIPSVKMFKDGKIIDEFVGVMPEEAIEGWIEKNI
ncbi:MAG: thioredoxin [Candidatus Woesearchaeota archaeon]